MLGPKSDHVVPLIHMWQVLHPEDPRLRVPRVLSYYREEGGKKVHEIRIDPSKVQCSDVSDMGGTLHGISLEWDDPLAAQSISADDDRHKKARQKRTYLICAKSAEEQREWAHELQKPLVCLLPSPMPQCHPSHYTGSSVLHGALRRFSYWHSPSSLEPTLDTSSLLLAFFSHLGERIGPASQAVNKPHPFPVTVSMISQALGKLRAKEENEGCTWRGMRHTRLPDNFMKEGGTEVAPMSCSIDLQVALQYALPREDEMDMEKRNSRHALLLKIVSDSIANSGVDISYLSCFPNEQEYTFPPLTFLKPVKKPMEIVCADEYITVTVVEVKPSYLLSSA